MLERSAYDTKFKKYGNIKSRPAIQYFFQDKLKNMRIFYINQPKK